jgi:hypothetical protein
MDTSSEVLFGEFASVIHESTHRANSSNSGFGRLAFFGGNDLWVYIWPFQVFRSEEIVRVMPEDATNKLYRFDDYLSPGNLVSANRKGIYGLMEEYSAYNSTTLFGLTAAETAMKKEDTALAIRFIQEVNESFPAYYEFRLYMAWYQETAAMFYPETWEAMEADTGLRASFTLLDNSCTATVDRLLKTGGIIQQQMHTNPLEGNDRVYGEYPGLQLHYKENWIAAFRLETAAAEKVAIRSPAEPDNRRN